MLYRRLKLRKVKSLTLNYCYKWMKTQDKNLGLLDEKLIILTTKLDVKKRKKVLAR